MTAPQLSSVFTLQLGWELPIHICNREEERDVGKNVELKDLGGGQVFVPFFENQKTEHERWAPGPGFPGRG